MRMMATLILVCVKINFTLKGITTLNILSKANKRVKNVDALVNTT